ncbi:MAG: peptidase M23 [Clostridium sp.]|uniref:peptidase M23 n=1 Tax=Clostridium sp. TaxID=1506 RepID=UPI0025C4E1E4|nr:peptidase M23 [Clostridium sp.]MCF0147522.1 peptidase M23 [Clostridium sp.]
MVNNYNEAYKDYYDKVRKKVSGNENKGDNGLMTKEYIYPNTSNVRNYTYGKGSYQINSSKKKYKYIDGFIIRLIITFMLFLVAFTLKVLPNKEAKELYQICKTSINSEFNYKKLLSGVEKLGFDYSGIKNNIEEKYKEVINQINDMNLDDKNNGLNL